VRALQKITGNTYADCYYLFARRGRKNNRGVNVTVQRAVFDELGIKIVREINRPHASVARLDEFCKPRGIYWVRVAGHVFVYIDGVIHDVAATSRGRHIRSIWELELCKVREAIEADRKQTDTLDGSRD
jgi:hypothetical protein